MLTLTEVFEQQICLTYMNYKQIYQWKLKKKKIEIIYLDFSLNSNYILNKYSIFLINELVIWWELKLSVRKKCLKT